MDQRALEAGAVIPTHIVETSHSRHHIQRPYSLVGDVAAPAPVGFPIGIVPKQQRQQQQPQPSSQQLPSLSITTAATTEHVGGGGIGSGNVVATIGIFSQPVSLNVYQLFNSCGVSTFLF